MIRKIKIIFAIVLCLTTLAVAYAGDLQDSNEIFDCDKLVTFSIKPRRYNANINDEISFKIIIQNNSDYKCYVKYLSRVFKGYDTPTISIDEVINAHDTLEVSLCTILNNTADWYKDGDNYYLDYNMRLNYSLVDGSDGSHSRYYSYQTNKASLLINNLYDGSDLIQLSCTDDGQETYLVKDASRYYNYSSSVENDIKVEVAVNYNLQDFTIYNNAFSHYQSTLLFYEKLELDNFSNYHYFTKISRVHELQTYITKIIWNTEGKYYLAILEKTYLAKILLMPKINITQESTASGYIVKIYNEADEDIKNLYIDYSLMGYASSISDNNILVIPVIKKNMFYEIETKTRLFKSNTDFIIGTKYDDYAALWKVNWFNSFDGTEYMRNEEYLGYEKISQELNPTPVPLATPTASAIDKNLPTATYIPSVEVAKQNNVKFISFALFGVIIVLLIIIIILISIHKKSKTN